MAFSSKQFSNILHSVEQLHKRMVRSIDFGMTTDELIDLVTNPEDIPILRKARQIANVATSYEGVSVPWDIPGTRLKSIHFEMYRRSGGPKLPFLPINCELQKHRYPELCRKIDAWVKQRVYLGREWGLVYKIVRLLNERCAMPKQVRYLWPSIVPLLTMNGHTLELGNRLSALQRPNSLPGFTPIEREALRRAGATVAGALLLPPLENEGMPPVELRLKEVEVYRMPILDEHIVVTPGHIVVTPGHIAVTPL